jgi:hypothetical protein
MPACGAAGVSRSLCPRARRLGARRRRTPRRAALPRCHAPKPRAPSRSAAAPPVPACRRLLPQRPPAACDPRRPLSPPRRRRRRRRFHKDRPLLLRSRAGGSRPAGLAACARSRAGPTHQHRRSPPGPGAVPPGRCATPRSPLLTAQRDSRGHSVAAGQCGWLRAAGGCRRLLALLRRKSGRRRRVTCKVSFVSWDRFFRVQAWWRAAATSVAESPSWSR